MRIFPRIAYATQPQKSRTKVSRSSTWSAKALAFAFSVEAKAPALQEKHSLIVYLFIREMEKPTAGGIAGNFWPQINTNNRRSPLSALPRRAIIKRRFP
jgi:hypothetical protein